MPLLGDGLVGELPDAPRVWRNGSRPANACGGQQVTFACYPTPVSQVMYCYLDGPGVSVDLPQATNPLEFVWRLPGPVAACKNFQVTLSCDEVPPDFHFEWFIRSQCTSLDGTQQFTAESNFIQNDGTHPLTLTAPLPSFNLGCVTGGLSINKVTITEAPRGRRIKALPVV